MQKQKASPWKQKALSGTSDYYAHQFAEQLYKQHLRHQWTRQRRCLILEEHLSILNAYHSEQFFTYLENNFFNNNSKSDSNQKSTWKNSDNSDKRKRPQLHEQQEIISLFKIQLLKQCFFDQNIAVWKNVSHPFLFSFSVFTLFLFLTLSINQHAH